MMTKIIFVISCISVLIGCRVEGVKNNHSGHSDFDTISKLSHTDSAFVNLKQEVKKIIPDSSKNTKGEDLVWNGKNGLRIEWLVKGDGSQIKNNDLVMVDFEARVARGDVYDHNKNSGHPIPLKLGVGQLLKGWELALLQMKIGDKGRIMIPSELAYGTHGYLGKVPQNADVIVKINIIDIITPIELSNNIKVYKYKICDTINPTPLKNQIITFDYFSYRKGVKPGLYDNSYAKGNPFEAKFENDNTVKGLQKGLKVLRAGDHAFIDIPYQMAYGTKGLLELVPSKTDISFDVRLISIK